MPHEHIQPREIDDTDFIISGLLGEGGSKTVFDTVINGKRRALAIPNSIDDPDTQAEKWNSVLQEPENAKLLSELGLLTVPEYEIITTTINGRELPALSMTPFSDLPFKVFDSKDGTQTYTHGPLSHIEHFQIFLPISLVLAPISPRPHNRESSCRETAYHLLPYRTDRCAYFFMTYRI